MQNDMPNVCIVLDCGSLEIFSDTDINVKVLNFDEQGTDFDLLNEEHTDAIKNLKRIY